MKNIQLSIPPTLFAFAILFIFPNQNCTPKEVETPVENPPQPKSEHESPEGQLKNDKAYVVMLGSGTPVLEPENSGPAVAIVYRGKSYLVDFGPGVVRRAEEAFRAGIDAIDPRKMTRAFVTHLHSDHTAGYSDLILSPPVVGREAPLEVWGPPGIAAMTKYIQAAYSADLDIRKKRKGIDDFTGYLVNPHEYKKGPIYVDKNVKVTAFPVNHGDWEHAYGFRFKTENRSIVISGDTRPSRNVIEACAGCDVLVHEVYCYDGWRQGESDWRSYHASYHTSAPELAELANKAKPKLLVLYHKLFFGCTPEQLLNEVKSKYKGKVVLGEDLGVY